MLLMLAGCDPGLPKDGVGEVIGLKFGVPLAAKIKVGPREPPIFQNHLREFYEVEFPNTEFDFVGVAVTRNDGASRMEGFVFDQENLIWGAMFLRNKPCEEKDFLRTRDYLARNWQVTPVGERRNKAGDPFYLDSKFTSRSAFWQISCAASGLSLIVSDYSVLRRAGNESTKQQVDRLLAHMAATFQRRM
jgi:hypothetical protein